jgi:hypothetical protein
MCPETQYDAWLWINGSEPDVTWEHARSATAAVGTVAVVAAEQPAFTYRDSRDLTGFVDGTANPPARRAAEISLVGPGQPGEGGSHVLAMRWVHDLRAFAAMPVAEQQRVFGRTKSDSVELAGADLPPTAHISRVQVDDGGAELQIFRRSVPAGPAAPALFAVGLLGASLLAAAVVPLSSSYAIAEAAGAERSISAGFRQAPLFYGLFTVQLVVGAGVALAPGNLVSLVVNMQVLNGLITPVLLTFVLILANRRSVLGGAANGRVFRVIATACVAAIGTLALTVLVMNLDLP